MQMSVPADGREQTLVYKVAAGQALELDFLPPQVKAFERAPLYFIIPGGGWGYCVKEDMIAFSRLSVDILREKGWAVASVEYRTWKRDGASMAQIVSDILDACRYLAHYAGVLGVETEKTVFSGHSAGGHLALMAALANEEDFPCELAYPERLKAIGCAPLSPPTAFDKDAAHPLYPADMWGGEMAGILFPAGDADYRRASPLSYIPKDVPLLLCAGDADPLVYWENSRLMQEKCRAAGMDCRLILSHNGGHCFEPMGEAKKSEPDMEAIQRETADFALALV